MSEKKKRVKAICENGACRKQFSYLPRTDGKPQRTWCYKCVPKKKGNNHE